MQETTFCAPCALRRLNDGEYPGLVLAGLPRDGARLMSDPLCAHHRRELHLSPVEEPRTEAPLLHYNGTPVMEVVDFEQRHFYEQIDIIDMINGTPHRNDGLLNVLRTWLRKWQIRRYLDEHIDEQPTTNLPPLKEIIAEDQENKRMFERIGGYLALCAAGLDTGPVMIEDDDRNYGGEE